MKIVNVGYNYRHSENFCINRPFGSGDYMLLILRTNAFFVLDGKKQFSAPNSVIIFKKGTPQIYGASNGEFINDWIHFEMEDEEVLTIEKLKIPFDTIISVNSVAEIAEFTKNMFREKYSQNIGKEKSLELYFELLLLKLYERINMPDFKRENIYYNELSLLRNEIYLKPDNDWSMNAICMRLKLSRSYIQHLYKAFFDESIISDITDSRIKHAQYLLSSTDMSVSYIAQCCGYNNDVHFMRIFKRTTGVTPSQFRKQTCISQNELKNSKSKNPFCL